MRTAVPVAAVLIVAALAALFVVARGGRRLPRARDLRQRRLRHPRRGRQGRRRQGRLGRGRRGHAGLQGRRRARDRRPGYQDFRSDAKCIVRPQSLIGEKFVECEPTQQRAVGAEPPARAARDRGRPGEGQRLLPVENTEQVRSTSTCSTTSCASPSASACRSSSTSSASAWPAAARTSTRSSGAPTRRSRRSTRSCGCWRARTSSSSARRRLRHDHGAARARARARLVGDREHRARSPQATAERRADLEADIERLPRFLRELRPTMVRLGALSDEMTPVLPTSATSAPDINRFLLELGPFSQAGIPALESLGDASRPRHARRSNAPAGDPRPAHASRAPRGRSATLADVLESFQRNDGIERLMDYLFYQAAAVNGFDSFGHYLRAGLIVNQCSTYASSRRRAARRTSASERERATAAPASMPRDPCSRRTARVLTGLDPAPAAEGQAAQGTARAAPRQAARTAGHAPPRPRRAPAAPAATRRRRPRPRPGAAPRADRRRRPRRRRRRRRRRRSAARLPVRGDAA